jgi:hypothetical protein
VWLRVECGSHRTRERGAASGSLHRWLDGCAATRGTPNKKPPINRRGEWQTHEQHNRPEYSPIIFQGSVLKDVDDVKHHQSEHEQHRADVRDDYVREKAGVRLMLRRVVEDCECHHHEEDHEKQQVNDGPDGEKAD